jgi:hypothetical protein
MMEYLLIVVLAGFTDHASCAAQAEHEQAYLDAAEGEGGLIATCIVQAPYAPAVTLRPVARP